MVLSTDSLAFAILTIFRQSAYAIVGNNGEAQPNFRARPPSRTAVILADYSCFFDWNQLSHRAPGQTASAKYSIASYPWSAYIGTQTPVRTVACGEKSDPAD
jgi:hypothetical protein